MSDMLEPELVNSSENLYMIHRYGIPKKVLELDFGEMKWVSPERKGEYAFFVSKVKSVAPIKPESWTDARTRYKSLDYFIDNDKSRKCMFYHQWMWYFPHDCLNVNLLDE
ncbi:unnamed protein product [Lactuca virosa]|uniref:Uncharacterized protein n=1 Tax=Lactuca virosa TaxID=75947 RepID=A0AAU9PHB9_9ASTR|nr:unnamed protein product [Lactuca virosa]